MTEAHNRLKQPFVLSVPTDDESGFLKETELPALLRKLIPLADEYPIRDQRQDMGANLDLQLERQRGSLLLCHIVSAPIDYLSRAHSAETRVLVAVMETIPCRYGPIPREGIGISWSA